VAGQKATIVLTIVRGVTVAGTVRNEVGDGMADVIVRCHTDADLAGPFVLSRDDNPHWPRPSTRTGADGHFVLRGLPTGTIHLAATRFLGPSEFESCSRTSVSGQAGEQLTWNPVLIAGKTIRVRVRDADGRLANAQNGLAAFAEEAAGFASELHSSPDRQEKGRYTFTGCADVPYTVCASWYEIDNQLRCRFITGVLPGGSEVEIRLPPEPPPVEFGEVRGSVLDQSQRLRGKAMSVTLYAMGSSQQCKVDGNRFSAANVMPGRYYLCASVDRDPVLVAPWFALAAGQHLDLGDLATQPAARVKVVLRTPPGIETGKPQADLVPPRGATFGGRWPLHWDGSALVSDNVNAGRWRLQYQSLDRYAPPVELDLIADQDNVFTVDLLPAARRKLDIVLPLPDRWTQAAITLRDGAGNTVADLILDSTRRGVAPFPWQETLPFGLVTLEIALDGQTHTWPVDLRGPVSADRPLRFSLR
jgi:hypothetical protein